jgi:hypothetical protein
MNHDQLWDSLTCDERWAYLACDRTLEEAKTSAWDVYLHENADEPVIVGPEVARVCDKCRERMAMHFETGPDGFCKLCCCCYVLAGGAPADWHRGCMEAERAKRTA